MLRPDFFASSNFKPGSSFSTPSLCQPIILCARLSDYATNECTVVAHIAELYLQSMRFVPAIRSFNLTSEQHFSQDYTSSAYFVHSIGNGIHT